MIDRGTPVSLMVLGVEYVTTVANKLMIIAAYRIQTIELDPRSTDVDIFKQWSSLQALLFCTLEAFTEKKHRFILRSICPFRAKERGCCRQQYSIVTLKHPIRIDQLDIYVSRCQACIVRLHLLTCDVISYITRVPVVDVRCSANGMSGSSMPLNHYVVRQFCSTEQVHLIS